MITKSKNLLCWQYVVGFLLVWATLTAVNLHWLIDNWYQWSFDQNASQAFMERIFTIDYLKDPAYFLVQAVLSSLFSFKVFFGILIFTCLALKFTALMQVNPRPGILDVAPYLLVLGFLHEGIQIRIAIALSIAIWGIIFFAKNQRSLALGLILFASAFHVSASAFFLVFAIHFFFEYFGRRIIFFGVLAATALAYMPFIPDLLIHVGVATDARFLHYSQGIIYQNQNSTGLFRYFVIFVAFLTIFAWYYFKPTAGVWKKLYSLSLVSGLLAISILQIFRFNVVVSSRLADLLLLPILLILGATLTQLKHEKKYFPLFSMSFALICYCAARSFISFNPLLFRTF